MPQMRMELVYNLQLMPFSLSRFGRRKRHGFNPRLSVGYPSRVRRHDRDFPGCSGINRRASAVFFPGAIFNMFKNFISSVVDRK